MAMMNVLRAKTIHVPVGNFYFLKKVFTFQRKYYYLYIQPTGLNLHEIY